MSPALKAEIIEHLDKLPEAKQREVLRIVRGMAGKRLVGTPGKNLAKFAGTISPEDADDLLEAMRESRQVEADAW